MDHFGEVCGGGGVEIRQAGLTVVGGGHGFQERAGQGAGFGPPAGHDDRAVPGAFRAAGQTDAYVIDAALGQEPLAASAGFEVGGAGVEEQIAVVQAGQESFDHGVRGGALAAEDEDSARAAEA